MYRRLVPLPDFCANDSSLVVTIADNAEHNEEYITGLYVSHSSVVLEYIVYCNITMQERRLRGVGGVGGGEGMKGGGYVH